MAKINFMRKQTSQQCLPLSSSSFRVGYPYCGDSSYDFGLSNLHFDNFAIRQDNIWPIDFASVDKISKSKSLSSIAEKFKNKYKVSEQDIENDLNFLNLLSEANVDNSFNNAKPICLNDLGDNSRILSCKKDKKEYKEPDLSSLESPHSVTDNGLSKPKNGLNFDVDSHLLDLLDTVIIDSNDKSDPDNCLISENSELFSLSDLANQHFENLASNETTEHPKEERNSFKNGEYFINTALNDNLNDNLLDFLPTTCDSKNKIKQNKFSERTNKSDFTNNDDFENSKVDDFLNRISLTENNLHEKENKSHNLSQFNDFVDHTNSTKIDCGNFIENKSEDSSVNLLSDVTSDFEPPIDLSACIKYKPSPTLCFDEILDNSLNNKKVLGSAHLEAPESTKFNCAVQDNPLCKSRRNKKSSLLFTALSSKPKINTFLQQKVLDVQNSMLKKGSNSSNITKPLNWKLAKPSDQSIFANYKCRFLFDPANCISQ